MKFDLVKTWSWVFISLFESSLIFSSIVVHHHHYSTQSTTLRSPPNCTTVYENQCVLLQKTKCTIENKEECKTEFTKKCDTYLTKQQCTTKTDREACRIFQRQKKTCKEAYNNEKCKKVLCNKTTQECKLVQLKNCKTPPDPGCETVEKRICTTTCDKSIPVQKCESVPKNICQIIPKERCVNIPTETCTKVPRKRCAPAKNLLPNSTQQPTSNRGISNNTNVKGNGSSGRWNRPKDLSHSKSQKPTNQKSKYDPFSFIKSSATEFLKQIVSPHRLH